MTIQLERNLHKGAYDKCGMHFRRCGLGELFSETIDLLASIPVVAQAPNQFKSASELDHWRENRLEVWGNDATVIAACRDKRHQDLELLHVHSKATSRQKAARKHRKGVGSIGRRGSTNQTSKVYGRALKRQHLGHMHRPSSKRRSVKTRCATADGKLDLDTATKKVRRPRKGMVKCVSMEYGHKFTRKDRPALPVQTSRVVELCTRAKPRKSCKQAIFFNEEGDCRGSVRTEKKSVCIPPLRLSKVEAPRKNSTIAPLASTNGILSQRRGSLSWRECQGPRMSGLVVPQSQTARTYDGERTKAVPLHSASAKSRPGQFSEDLFGKSFCLDRSGWGELSEAASCTTAAPSVRLEEELSQVSGLLMDMIDQEIHTPPEDLELTTNISDQREPTNLIVDDEGCSKTDAREVDAESTAFFVELFNNSEIDSSAEYSGDERDGLLGEQVLLGEEKGDHAPFDDTFVNEPAEDGYEGSCASKDPFEMTISEMDFNE